MLKIAGVFCIFFLFQSLTAQLKWTNVDSLYQPLPPTVRIYKTNDSLGEKPIIAYYLIADLKDKHLLFDADTTLNRRLTPTQFYEKDSKPLVCRRQAATVCWPPKSKDTTGSRTLPRE